MCLKRVLRSSLIWMEADISNELRQQQDEEDWPCLILLRPNQPKKRGNKTPLLAPAAKVERYERSKRMTEKLFLIRHVASKDKGFFSLFGTIRLSPFHKE